MKLFWRTLRALLGGAFVAGALAGCGSLPGGTDLVERVNNAIAVDDVSFVRSLVESRTLAVNQLVPAPAYMEGTPLITIAARAGAVEVTRYLVGAGADINARTPAGETPVMLAVYFGSEDGRASYRHDSVVRALIAAGATLDNNMGEYTPVAYAAYQGMNDTLRYLLARGAPPNVELENGLSYVNTPLMMAAIMGHTDCAVTLLEAGADPRVRVKDGHTARELAEKYRHERLARLLGCAERLAPGQRIVGSCL